MATVDALTGLMNRRGFLTMAENHFALATREHRVLALMFVDVDGLKEVNDRLGHTRPATTRSVRRGIALQETFRSSDVATRVGGDEFRVLLTAPSAMNVPAAIDLPDHPDGTTIDDLMAVAGRADVRGQAPPTSGNEHVQA
jgi:diguanylate cyclase (GGDEF)-like protein